MTRETVKGIPYWAMGVQRLYEVSDVRTMLCLSPIPSNETFQKMVLSEALLLTTFLHIEWCIQELNKRSTRTGLEQWSGSSGLGGARPGRGSNGAAVAYQWYEEAFAQ